jgi:hypothetical protein
LLAWECFHAETSVILCLYTSPHRGKAHLSETFWYHKIQSLFALKPFKNLFLFLRRIKNMFTGSISVLALFLAVATVADASRQGILRIRTTGHSQRNLAKGRTATSLDNVLDAER